MIDDPAAAVVALDPLRARVLAALTEPGSATTVAASLGVSRQRVSYHLSLLEAHGLVDFVEERPRRGLTERIVVASARAFVIAPDLVGSASVEPEPTDRMSSSYLMALAARLAREVAQLRRAAQRAGRPLGTLAIDADLRFRSAKERAEFTNDLTAAIADLTARYHDESSPGGRWHRLVVASHPRPANPSSAEVSGT